MKHVLALLLLVAGAIFFATRTPALDRLMIPVTGAAAQRGGISLVQIDPQLMPVKPAFLAVSGVITIVYFRDKDCGGVESMDRDIAEFLTFRPDVAVRTVNIQVERGAYYQAIHDFKWKVYVSPSVIIFDQKGKTVEADEGTDISGSELLRKWMVKEADKAATRAVVQTSA